MVTGHTGFKGAWLITWLLSLGSEVVGYSLEPPSEPNLFDLAGLEKRITHIHGDVRDIEHLEETVKRHSPEFVFHLAAQSLVRASYEEPHLTFETNIMGTVNILEAIRRVQTVKVCQIITSDKCYQNREWVYAYRENDALGGHDPYSSSKACAELVTSSFRDSFFNPANRPSKGTAISTVRAGNVIGGGDWACDRLVPDCIRALSSKETLIIRNPKAIRPWQHVLEPLSGYLMLASMMYDGGDLYPDAWNFGPLSFDNIEVGHLADLITHEWGEDNKNATIEKGAVRDSEMHESHYLKLDCTKAHNILGWKPSMSVVDAVQMTIDWYRTYYKDAGKDILDLTTNQIENFVTRAKALGQPWAEGTGA